VRLCQRDAPTAARLCRAARHCGPEPERSCRASATAMAAGTPYGPLPPNASAARAPRGGPPCRRAVDAVRQRGGTGCARRDVGPRADCRRDWPRRYGSLPSHRIRVIPRHPSQPSRIWAPGRVRRPMRHVTTRDHMSRSRMTRPEELATRGRPRDSHSHADGSACRVGARRPLGWCRCRRSIFDTLAPKYGCLLPCNVGLWAKKIGCLLRLNDLWQGIEYENTLVISCMISQVSRPNQ
jgi:hypothetical protein